MNFNFYKTTDAEFIGKLEAIRQQKMAFSDHINSIAEKVGAEGWKVYRHGSLAFFEFSEQPDRSIWKKAHDGFMPKLSNKEGKLIANEINKVPSPESYSSILREFKFPMMVFGDATSRGVAMHNSTVFGSFARCAFFVKVPKAKNFNFVPPSIFEKVKEWEAMKFMDEDAA